MSKKSPKVIRNNKKKSDRQQTIEELQENIKKMQADKENKCESAKKQLVDMLEVTVDKYRTATGTAEALRVLRFVHDGKTNADLKEANDLALHMATVAKSMSEKAIDLEPSEMDQLCDGFYEKELKLGAGEAGDSWTLAAQMMVIDLCRNVGGAAEDMVDFVKRVQEEIESTQKTLDSLLEEEAAETESE